MTIVAVSRGIAGGAVRMTMANTSLDIQVTRMIPQLSSTVLLAGQSIPPAEAVLTSQYESKSYHAIRLQTMTTPALQTSADLRPARGHEHLTHMTRTMIYTSPEHTDREWKQEGAVPFTDEIQITIMLHLLGIVEDRDETV
jgi:hypothetical protein